MRRKKIKVWAEVCTDGLLRIDGVTVLLSAGKPSKGAILLAERDPTIAPLVRAVKKWRAWHHGGPNYPHGWPSYPAERALANALAAYLGEKP